MSYEITPEAKARAIEAVKKLEAALKKRGLKADVPPNPSTNECNNLSGTRDWYRNPMKGLGYLSGNAREKIR